MSGESLQIAMWGDTLENIRDRCEEFTWIQGTSHSRLIWLLGDIPVESFEPADKNTLIVWVSSEYITEELKRRNGNG